MDRRGQKTALVLCGGGSRGALELGFHRALVELGVPIDFIVGSSVGALNGAFIAAGESAEKMNALWRSIRFRDLFGLNWRALVNPRRADSIYGNLRLRHFIQRYLPAKRFEDLRVPLTILATDVNTGKGIHLARGDLTEAILASVVIPGLLPPVFYQGRQLIDGGVTNNLPLDVAVEKGATTALAIRCRCERTRREPVHGIANILLRSFDISDSLKYEQDSHRYDGVCEMILVTPCFDFDVGFLDFRHSEKLIDMAYEATIEARDEFTRLIANRQTPIAADVRAQISTSVLRKSSKSG